MDATSLVVTIAVTGAGIAVGRGQLHLDRVSLTSVTSSDGGITWRGTFYPLKELRKNRV